MSEVLQPAPSSVPHPLLKRTAELEELELELELELEGHTEYLQRIYWLVHKENSKYLLYVKFGLELYF